MGKRTNTAKWIAPPGRWQINVQKDGQRKTFTSSKPGRTGQREANAKADAWLDEGIHDTSKRVATLYDDYIESLKVRTSKANWIKVDNFGGVWLKSAIGNRKISDVTEQQLQNIIDQAYKKGRSRKTLRNFVSFIRGFFKFCRMEHVTTLNPEFLTIPAGARYKGHNIIQPEGLRTLFSSDQTMIRGKRVHDDFICAYRLAVLTGLRPGELKGLRWSDVDGDVLHINGAINQLGERTKGKNENAIRTIKLPPMAKIVLDEQRSDTMCEEYVFFIGSMQNYNRRWKAYCAANGIPSTSLYEMRHTFVSVCKALPEGQLKAIVGHSAAMDTFGVYGHEVDGEKVQIAAEVETLFKSILKQPAIQD